MYVELLDRYITGSDDASEKHIVSTRYMGSPDEEEFKNLLIHATEGDVSAQHLRPPPHKASA